MVKKSKRKQTVVPFEKTISAVVVNVSPFTDIVGGERACGEVNDILQTVILLSECDTLADQMKLLQERKGVLKVGKLVSFLACYITVASENTHQRI